jgi:hypothetical protein
MSSRMIRSKPEPPTHGFSGRQADGLIPPQTTTCNQSLTPVDPNVDKILQDHPELKQLIISWRQLTDYHEPTA